MSRVLQILRPAERTSITIWRTVAAPEQVKEALKGVPGFVMVKQGQARVEVASRLVDHSLPLLRSDVMNVESGFPQMIFQYAVDIYRDGESVFISGKEDIAAIVYDTLASSYQGLFGSEMPVHAQRVDIRKLVQRHKGRVCRLHAQMKNTEGLNSLTLYGDDVLRSELYQEQLATATFSTATLCGPFGLHSISVEFSDRGSFNTDSILCEEDIKKLVVILVHEYHT